LRKLAAAITSVAVLAMPAAALAQPRWHRGTRAQVTVYPQHGRLGTLNYDPKTNTAWYGSLHLNTRYLTYTAARRKTACHELGHPGGTDHATLRRIYARP
jgi:hypothetical protein